MTKARLFKEMLAEPGMITAAGVYDALGARIASDVGFKAVYMTGNGAMSSLLGKPDLGLATMTEMVTRAHQIAACVDIPLICDADTGYGTLGNVRRTIQEYESCGIAGVHIEDQIVQKRCGALGGVQVVSMEDAMKRLEAAASGKSNDDFTIIARTDAKDVFGLEEAIHRVKNYVKAGADAIMVEGLNTLDEVKRVVDSVDAPVLYNIYEPAIEDEITLEKLEKLGVKITINCLTTTLCAAQMMKDFFTEFLMTGSTDSYKRKMMPMAEYTRILGIDREMKLLEGQV